jgi:ornithine cyclodeaminase/alanine dehydrogenase-like protein (mu-crystallin family)
MTLLLSEQDIEGLLSFEAAVPVAEEAFRMIGEGTAINPPRFRMPFEKGFLQFGPAALIEKRIVGFKYWANFGYELGAAQRQVWNYIHDIDTHELLAIIQAYTIGKFRTSAVSAVAAKHLSLPQASTVGIYGAGRYAEGQLTALAAVRPIKMAKVYARTVETRERFCRKMSEQLKFPVVAANTPEEACQAEIVVTMTNSETPVLQGDWLPPSCLIIAAGANHWFERELDLNAVCRASLILVDELEQAKVESGDILYAVGKGRVAWSQVKELGAVIAGRLRPKLGDGVILFESHGLAVQDMAISLEAHKIARERGIGRELRL